MEEQSYIIENQESFELEDIFECGQCFRWNKLDNGSYLGVIKDSVINVKKDDNKIIFKGTTKKSNFTNLVRDYFDLDRNYDELKNRLSKVDENLEIATKFGKRH